MRKSLSRAFKCPLFMGDMSNFQIGEEFDAVVSCCDSVNYLPDKDAVQNFIYCSQDALKSGGLLLFDINTPVKFKEVNQGQYLCL